MSDIDDFHIYLPQYLSEESEQKLFQNLSNYPNNIAANFYVQHDRLAGSILQGDGLRKLLVINSEDLSKKEVPCMIISNSCDIDPANLRPFQANVIYTPIFNLKKFSNGLESAKIKTGKALADYIELIKKQRITQMLYLPPLGTILEESFVFLDRLFNLPLEKVVGDTGKDVKLFTLDDYGFYIFLYKISLHFTRIREKIDRHAGVVL
jgi:hypothetical protein